MKFLKKTILPILLAAIWISIAEFGRNELFGKSYWINHYKELGIDFPDKPINAAIWGLWSILFATTIFVISKKFSLMQTFLLSWFVGFVLIWVVIGNLNVLPFGILVYAFPLSMLEVFIAAWIIKKFY